MHKFAHLEDEHLKNIYRQSKLFLFKGFVVPFAILLIPTYFLWQYQLLNQFKRIILLGTIIIGLWFLRNAIIWFRNCYVLTNLRLILFAHEGLFKRTVIETPLERVLNVSYKTTGVMSAIFGYGDVEVQVVGLVEPIILKHIPDPAGIKDYLWQMHKRVVDKPIAFDAGNIAHSQEKIGYTKKNQKVL
jgi:hypothetical protein